MSSLNNIHELYLLRKSAEVETPLTVKIVTTIVSAKDSLEDILLPLFVDKNNPFNTFLEIIVNDIKVKSRITLSLQSLLS